VQTLKQGSITNHSYRVLHERSLHTVTTDDTQVERGGEQTVTLHDIDSDKDVLAAVKLWAETEGGDLLLEIFMKAAE